MSDDFNKWIEELEEMPHPQCNMDDPDECEECGS